MKKLVTSFVTTAILATGLFAKSLSNASNTEVLQAGLTTASTVHYDYLYNLQGKKIGYRAYMHYTNPYNLLIGGEVTEKRRSTEQWVWGSTGDNTIAETLFQEDFKNDRLKQAHLLQLRFIGTTIEVRQALGLPVNLTYTVQKRTGKTAVTITLNIPEILTRYATFLKTLRAEAHTKEQFNKYFKTLATLFYWVEEGDDWNRKTFGEFAARTIVFTEKLYKYDILSPYDFLKIIFGEDYVTKTELAHNARLAKLVNYILTANYQKAIEMIKNPDEDLQKIENYLTRVLNAEAKMENPYVRTRDNTVYFLTKKSFEIFNKLPASVRYEKPDAHAAVKAYLLCKKYATEIANKHPNIDLRAPIK